MLTSKCASRHNGVHFFDIATSKSAPKLRCLYILTWKCTSRHNGVHFFDISTSKSGPDLVCFVHFDLEMYFAPQRRALFRHLNFRKWSEHGVFCTLTSTCASRQNGVHFFISHLARWLRTRRSSLFYSSLLSDSSHLCFSSVHIVGSLTSKLPSIILYLYTSDFYYRL